MLKFKLSFFFESKNTIFNPNSSASDYSFSIYKMLKSEKCFKNFVCRITTLVQGNSEPKDNNLPKGI